MNGLNNFDKTDREYSLALIMTWLDFVGQGQGHTLVQVCGGKDIHVDVGAFHSIF